MPGRAIRSSVRQLPVRQSERREGTLSRSSQEPPLAGRLPRATSADHRLASLQSTSVGRTYRFPTEPHLKLRARADRYSFRQGSPAPAFSSPFRGRHERRRKPRTSGRGFRRSPGLFAVIHHHALRWSHPNPTRAEPAEPQSQGSTTRESPLPRASPPVKVAHAAVRNRGRRTADRTVTVERRSTEHSGSPGRGVPSIAASWLQRIRAPRHRALARRVRPRLVCPARHGLPSQRACYPQHRGAEPVQKLAARSSLSSSSRRHGRAGCWRGQGGPRCFGVGGGGSTCCSKIAFASQGVDGGPDGGCKGSRTGARGGVCGDRNGKGTEAPEPGRGEPTDRSRPEGGERRIGPD
jgi:hypothetical protein